MGFLNKLFNNKMLNLIDPEIGEFKTINIIGRKVLWQTEKNLFGLMLEIRISGNKKGIAKNQKQILLEILNNEAQIELEAQEVLKKQFEDSVMDFISIESHFDTIGIIVEDAGFELTFQENDGQFRFFNLFFEKNTKTKLSIEEF